MLLGSGRGARAASHLVQREIIENNTTSVTLALHNLRLVHLAGIFVGGAFRFVPTLGRERSFREQNVARVRSVGVREAN